MPDVDIGAPLRRPRGRSKGVRHLRFLRPLRVRRATVPERKWSGAGGGVQGHCGAAIGRDARFPSPGPQWPPCPTVKVLTGKSQEIL